MRVFTTFICILVLGLTTSIAGQDSPVLDESMKVRYFEEINYPLMARLKHIQGVVVVKVKLDDNGTVISAAAVSGAKDLIQDSLLNAKKWLFQANPDKTAIIVYHFKIDGLCKLPCTSHFTFSPPNSATITMGEPIIDHPVQ